MSPFLSCCFLFLSIHSSTEVPHFHHQFYSYLMYIYNIYFLITVGIYLTYAAVQYSRKCKIYIVYIIWLITKTYTHSHYKYCNASDSTETKSFHLQIMQREVYSFQFSHNNLCERTVCSPNTIGAPTGKQLVSITVPCLTVMKLA